MILLKKSRRALQSFRSGAISMLKNSCRERFFLVPSSRVEALHFPWIPGINRTAPVPSRIIPRLMALHGTSVRYITSRLKREGQTALLAAVETGKITALAAAVELGWVLRPPKRGGSTHKAKRIAHQLRTITGEGLSAGQKMELIYGPNPSQGSSFNSREELVQAWTACRHELLDRANPGRRPLAYYEFDYPHGTRPPFDTERSTLWRQGVLKPEERVELKREWRMEFDAALAMDASERREHLEHHDVPVELVKRWAKAAERAERRRRARSIGNPTAEAQENAPGEASGAEG